MSVAYKQYNNLSYQKQMWKMSAKWPFCPDTIVKGDVIDFTAEVSNQYHYAVTPMTKHANYIVGWMYYINITTIFSNKIWQSTKSKSCDHIVNLVLTRYVLDHFDET